MGKLRIRNPKPTHFKCEMCDGHNQKAKNRFGHLISKKTRKFVLILTEKEMEICPACAEREEKKQYRKLTEGLALAHNKR